MPGIARKLVIYATANSLVLQPVGATDSYGSLQIEYNSRSVRQHGRLGPESFKQISHLECHGIIGLLTIASRSFLLCIIRREQVAQVFGKPIYVIRDIAILPVSSLGEAEESITQIREQLQKAKTGQDSDTASFASEGSGFESFDESSVRDPSESGTPVDTRPKASERNENSTNVVQDVIERKGQYGKFASQWFSRRGWGLNKKRLGASSSKPVPSNPIQDEKTKADATESTLVKDHLPVHLEAVRQPDDSVEVSSASKYSHEAATEMLPKILRTVKLLFASQSFYFSYDFNITQRFGSSSVSSIRSVSPDAMEQQYFWNRQLAIPFTQPGFSFAVMPVMQGFVGQQPFVVKKSSEDETHAEASTPLEDVLKAEPDLNKSQDEGNSGQSFLLTLISRRSVKRSGLRYLRRGIDDGGNCANSVETEQILSSPTWEQSAKIRSFVQVRGSIPLYFSQSPYAFKPVPIIHQSAEINRRAFDQHFDALRRKYGFVHVVLLVDKQGGEKRIGEEYESVTKSSNESGEGREIGFNWFDFHTECRGMKFENVHKLIHASEDTIDSFGETVIVGQNTIQKQTGVMRTNCMDCLDRTNVVQSAFAQYMLQKDLEAEGLEIDFVKDLGTQWFNTLWADNGDSISRQYASTAALKGDYTRTRKRNYRGALNDFGLTLTRYYNNIVNDYFSQTVVDLLLGNVTWRIFEDFEATMMSADPGISIDKIRQNAIDTCSKIVIQDSEEDLLDGWAMSTPAHTNTLRTLPFEEAIVLLTDHAIYCCKFDWATEKVTSFERVDLRSITKIHYGTYITSTLTEGQMDKDLNVGLVISYTPGKESVKRVNTRSLQVSTEVTPNEKAGGNSDSAFLSWLPTRGSASSQCMAMKVIPDQSHDDGKIDLSPLVTAEQICNSIQRAVLSGIPNAGERDVGFVEKADIISVAEAHSRTGYLEQFGHSIKKLVWT